MLKEENYDERDDLIVKAFQYWQKCWADELNARPTEEKSTIKGFCLPDGPGLSSNPT